MTLELTFTEEGKSSDQLSDLSTPSQTGQQHISLYATESRLSTVMLTRIIFCPLLYPEHHSYFI